MIQSRMKDYCIELSIFFILILLNKTVGGNCVHLTPSPEASVKEGEILDLHCDWIGSSALYTVNWYLNDDIYGLVFDAKNCTYITKPDVYEINRYKLTCNPTNFILSIVSIIKVKDDGDKWECDCVTFDMKRSVKASTTIRVIEAVILDGNGGGIGMPNNEEKVIGGVLAGLIPLVLVSAVGYLIYRRKKDWINNCLTCCASLLQCSEKNSKHMQITILEAHTDNYDGPDSQMLSSRGIQEDPGKPLNNSDPEEV